jgi:OFA family oxalate/formate antiporter-like MFS transporter
MSTSSQAAAPALKRWPVAVAGILMQMFLGTVYAWSAYKKPLLEAHKAQNWTGPQVGVAFTLVILFIGLSAAFGGKLVDRAGSRKVATIGAILFALGTLCAGLADRMGSLWLLWIGYGVIGGTGNGLGYITPIAVLVRWFPDRRGMITGLAVMGFGLGAAVMGKVVPMVLPSLGIANTFFLSGGLFLVGLLLAAQKLNNPPADWVAPASTKGSAKQATELPPCDLRGALSMYQFYVLWAVMFFNITAGLMLISNLSPFAQQQLGIDAGAAGTILFVTALANGFGRILWAALSDLIGRKPTFLLLVGTQIPLFLILPHITSFPLFTVVCSYLLLCYGGGFGSMPAFAADTFGTKCMGEVYGKILLAWGIAGIVGPTVMDMVQKASSNYSAALLVAAGVLAAGFLLTLTYRKPEAIAETVLPAVAEGE